MTRREMQESVLVAGKAHAESVDPDDRVLLGAVRPPDWVNPEPRGTYDLIVLGGGTAGLVSAVGAAGLGARVALIERHRLGGDCLNTGCVPSKALLRSARTIGEARRALDLGVRVQGVDPDFPAVMRRMRKQRARLSPNDSARRLQQAGIDVFFGSGRFTSARVIEVDARSLRFNRAVIATGTRPSALSVPGLDTIPTLTNETLFDLTELPRRLLIVGAGPIGCEMAQAFARFGSAVTLFDQAPRILPNEDEDAAAIVERRLRDDGVRVELSVMLTAAMQHGEGARLQYHRASGAEGGQVDGDRVLVATGRTANVEGLGLETANVAVSKDGVVVNDFLRTSNRRVYAAGDVCSHLKFTHLADATARIVVQNALFYGRRRASALVTPWCTYTDPEVAHVGLSGSESRSRGRRVDTITIPLTEVDRAVLDEETDGFVRVHHERGRLLGCTIVASHAGEIIGEVAFAMTRGGTLSDLSATIHPYPTQANALHQAGDQYRRSLLTPRVRSWMERYFRWTR
ncbi:MAG TPA: mercuric reductase [Vicinamibacterales bacterium]|nr:mercuric reductase [Vicinamibacterales bacterium]